MEVYIKIGDNVSISCDLICFDQLKKMHMISIITVYIF